MQITTAISIVTARAFRAAHGPLLEGESPTQVVMPPLEGYSQRELRLFLPKALQIFRHLASEREVLSVEAFDLLGARSRIQLIELPLKDARGGCSVRIVRQDEIVFALSFRIASFDTLIS